MIQSGGKGPRLRPYITILPKPLLPVGEHPVLEMLLRWLRRNGAPDVHITTGDLGHLIRTFCDDGRRWDLNISYTQEIEPLGTIAALCLLRGVLDETFLVINGAVLTDLHLNGFIATHRQHGSALTIATARGSVRLDFGIIEAEQNKSIRLRKRLGISHLMSKGIYCMEPNLLQHLPCGLPFGFDDLLFRLLDLRIPVGTFLHNGLWLDIGRIEDFQKAQALAWDEDAPAYDMTPLTLETMDVV